MTRRSGVTLVEALIAAALVLVLAGLVSWLLIHGRRSTARLSASFSAQQAGRQAVLRLIQEIQEGMEVVTPLPGATLSYALVRDRVSALRWYHLVANDRGSYDLWRKADDVSLPDADRSRLLVRNLKRMTFTSLGEGALQINLVLLEETAEFPLLTTIRLRNLASAEEFW